MRGELQGESWERYEPLAGQSPLPRSLEPPDPADLVGPCQDQGDGEAEKHEDDDVWSEGVQAEGFQDQYRSTENAEAHRHVDRSDPKDLPSFQLTQEGRDSGGQAFGYSSGKRGFPATLALRGQNDWADPTGARMAHGPA